VTARALAAIMEARLYVSRRLIGYSYAFVVLVALLQPAGTLAPLFCCTLFGIVIALDQSVGRHPHLDRCEASAPLFGRELARAKALVPCIAVLFAVVLYACAQLARRSPDAPLTLLVVSPAVVAATLVTLSATMRGGWKRALYVLVACGTAIAAYALAIAVGGIAPELAFCALAAFLALRQYGETLARYDPV
jgi:hypothetical protein